MAHAKFSDRISLILKPLEHFGEHLFGMRETSEAFVFRPSLSIKYILCAAPNIFQLMLKTTRTRRKSVVVVAGADAVVKITISFFENVEVCLGVSGTVEK